MNRKRLGDVALWGLTICAVVAAVTFVRSEYLPRRGPGPRIERQVVGDVAALSGAGHSIGDAEAPIVLVEFSDFQCPFCQRLQRTLLALQARRPGAVKIVYRHFPLAGHTLALPAAVASECAAEAQRFPAYAQLLFEKQDSIGLISWEAFAIRAGIRDTVRFVNCRVGVRATEAVRLDIEAGRRIGLEGTPAIIVNGRMIIGAVPLDTLEAFVLTASGKRSFPEYP